MPSREELLNAEDDEDRTAVLDLREHRAELGASLEMRHLLVRVEGDEIGQIVPLGNEPLVVGRHSSCDLRLNDSGISRRHARIYRTREGYVIEDLGSVNGTYVDGQRTKGELLHDGNLIQLGSSAPYRYSVTDAEQHAMLQHLYHASVTDALTGAYNREYFDTRLASELAYARRHNVELALLLLDIDHFKRINDKHGHPAGDVVLVELVRAIRSRLRAEDVFCRYGGEEFTIILRTTDLKSAVFAAERIRLAVEGMSLQHEGQSIPVTVSIGCASLGCCEESTVESLVATADRRLYAAKAGGRNRVGWA